MLLDRQPEFREQADNFFGVFGLASLIGEIPDSVFLLIWQRTQAQTVLNATENSGRSDIQQIL